MMSNSEVGVGSPDEKESEGYTGNAGCTMDYWYRRAAVVWWMREDHESVLCEYDLSGACRELQMLAKKRGIEHEGAFHRLALSVVKCFPEDLPHANWFTKDHDMSLDSEEEDWGTEEEEDFEDLGHETEEAFTLTLAALADAQSSEWLTDLVARVPPEAFGLCRVPLWKALFKAFGTAPFESVLQNLTQEAPEKHRGTLFTILDALSDRPGDAYTVQRIISGLIYLAPRPPRPSWRSDREPNLPGNLHEARVLLKNSPIIKGKKNRDKARSFLLGDESLGYIRGILGPLLMDRSLRALRREKASLYAELLAFATKKLATEVARDLRPYPNWSRPCPPPKDTNEVALYSYGFSRTGNTLIEELTRFMANPSENTYEFKRPQHERALIEKYIKRHSLDLDQTTSKKSSPHTLRVTKNDASFRQALTVRAKDEDLLARLRDNG